MQPQHMTALDLAQAARLRKANVKKLIAREEVDPAEIARHSSISFRVGELLMSIKGMGEIKARKICRETGLPYTGLIASNRAPKTHVLTDRQREVLADAIELFVELRGHPTKVRNRIVKARLAA